MKKLILLSFLALIASCQNSKIDYNYPDSPENIRNKRAGKFFDNQNLLTSQVEKPAQKPVVKNQLWLSSVEIISALLPIDVADQDSGLIVTEWYKEGQTKDSRIKINLLVKGADAKKENLILTIFRQTKNDRGVWTDEQSTSQSLSAQMIRDKIIEKANSK
ncbi:MAG: DUF3576 domain-containing protein [Pseudomonadota bacterium]